MLEVYITLIITVSRVELTCVIMFRNNMNDFKQPFCFKLDMWDETKALPGDNNDLKIK